MPATAAVLAEQKPTPEEAQHICDVSITAVLQQS